MSPEQTIAKMKEMKLSAAAEAYEHQQIGRAHV